MEIDEKTLTEKDWKTLEETADQIIQNATRDLFLWTNVRKEVIKQKAKVKDNKKPTGVG